ncbi:homeobox protein Hox-B4-like [Mus caroli]|uniref:Homeobox protein Hox-B4-like n=1 Tax=Mus caroli TaxID=10089 RepID=A0A6P7QR97_MUSCR|nr:homeobox protein Hox-B4-like [Mus caroli]
MLVAAIGAKVTPFGPARGLLSAPSQQAHVLLIFQGPPPVVSSPATPPRPPLLAPRAVTRPWQPGSPLCYALGQRRAGRAVSFFPVPPPLTGVNCHACLFHSPWALIGPSFGPVTFAKGWDHHRRRLAGRHSFSYLES